MPHGTPDFWGAAPKDTTYGLGDMAELAVRLGSFVNYDRRGEVIWANSFGEGGRDYTSGGGGTGNAIYLTADQALHNGLCMVLQTGTAENDYAWISKLLSYPVLGGIGHEVTFTPVPTLKAIYVQLVLGDGALEQQYYAMYDHVAGTIAVKTTAGAYTVIGTPGPLSDTYSAYSQLKMVVNCLTGKYVRVLVNEHTYDASAVPVYSYNHVAKKAMNVVIYVTCGATGLAEVRVDNLIVTQNEPV